ncbi:UDP-glucuronosyltransferase-like [Nelusetta ayraudi]|uniref:UDP-glucuronosyltransferase-like n=1 Tax=Nelusetta ayraudi TaxID=303726 RepID=UPI003F6F0F7F
MRSGMWFPTLGLLAWLCCCSLESVQAGKVLVMPMDGSHWLSMKILVKELVRKGHDVLVLVPEYSMQIKESESYKTEIYEVPITKADLDRIFKAMTDKVFLKPSMLTELFDTADLFVNYTTTQVKACKSLLRNERIMSKLREASFDVVLTDPFLPCGPILAQKFSIPIVNFLHTIPGSLDMEANQVPTPLSYVPVTFSGNTDIMTFPQRVKNMLTYGLNSYLCNVMYRTFDKLVVEEVKDMTSFKELLGHGAFWLVRSNFAFDWPKPIMPNMAMIGGINCAKNAALPADLEEFVNGSGDDGFIIFTLGSMVAIMPEEKAQLFFDAFRQIPQRVLWRYTGPAPANVPKNVKLMKWLPQNDLLAHPKVKVFMTHGGSHGIFEGICNAVPMLMFPLFGDQKDNVNRMVSRGAAKRLAVHEFTTEELVVALKELVQDRSYKENIVKLSHINQDRPVSALELATFWTEFVMKHKGADHLRVAAHDLNWFQYHSLDVIAFLLAIVLVVVGLTLKCCLFCTRKLLGKGAVKKKRQ